VNGFASAADGTAKNSSPTSRRGLTAGMVRRHASAARASSGATADVAALDHADARLTL
jgi:hypothetical protein